MRVNVTRVNRFFNIVLGALAMLAVALLSAYISMRIAIHGREVLVPNLAGLSIADAGKKAASLGLRTNLENRFYAPGVPAGHIIAQFPAAGTRVRRDWAVRVTESLGPQQVVIPDLVGQSERLATIAIRRLPLEVGTIAHLPTSAEPDTVLAQTPTANAENVDRPQISLLLSQPLDPQNPQSVPGYVMPSLAGLTLASASARASAAGLHIVSVEDLNAPTPATPAAAPAPQAAPTAQSAATPAPTAPKAPAPAPPTAVPTFSMGTVVAQTPPAGHRVIQGEPVRLVLGH